MRTRGVGNGTTLALRPSCPWIAHNYPSGKACRRWQLGGRNRGWLVDRVGWEQQKHSSALKLMSEDQRSGRRFWSGLVGANAAGLRGPPDCAWKGCLGGLGGGVSLAGPASSSLLRSNSGVGACRRPFRQGSLVTLTRDLAWRPAALRVADERNEILTMVVDIMDEIHGSDDDSGGYGCIGPDPTIKSCHAILKRSLNFPCHPDSKRLYFWI